MVMDSHHTGNCSIKVVPFADPHPNAILLVHCCIGSRGQTTISLERIKLSGLDHEKQVQTVGSSLATQYHVRSLGLQQRHQ
jgi:hypothetical protein